MCLFFLISAIRLETNFLLVVFNLSLKSVNKLIKSSVIVIFFCLADKELLFNGLTAVISYLCELDSVPNVMDYSKLFEYENNEPIYHLETILK